MSISNKVLKLIFTVWFLSDNFVLSISSSLILMGLLFLWKALYRMPFSPKYIAFGSILILLEENKSTFFILIF